MTQIKIGHGYDAHRLSAGRRLVLGGVEIPFEKGLVGHSDADVLTHAVMDALLGAAGLRDIGVYFPSRDERYRGAASTGLLYEVGKEIRAAGYGVGNIDATVVAVKATTTEGLGFEGEGLGISATAVCILEKL
jgi:2-C-methyl-D-erythritol 2,4-cyclodiphosphate synthase